VGSPHWQPWQQLCPPLSRVSQQHEAPQLRSDTGSAILEADRLGHGATERDQVIGRSRRSHSRGRDRQTNDRSGASCRKR